MAAPDNKKYFIISIIFHVAVLLVIAVSFESSILMPVLENTNKQDVISAVVLGDTPKSKIVPQKIIPQAVPKPKEIAKEEPKPKEAPKPQQAKQTQPDKDVIALEASKKKKLAEKKLLDDMKAMQEKMRRDLLAQDLLSDIKKNHEKQKKTKQKNLASKFEKTIREQAEKSLRQQLLNEEIKLQGTQSRQSQGEVDKYKALIIQAISERWIIPTTANKRLYCELLIRVAPGGMVLDVQVSKSSGDPSLDSSARAAVLKASPLPVPSDPGAFEAFRQFALKVKPENIIASDGGMSAG